MLWGEIELSPGIGPASRVLLVEYDRRCKEHGVDSASVRTFVPSELGFEHNLGLLHSSYRIRASRPIRQGVIEHEYYLERCLLEAEGAMFSERGLAMCASVVGDDMARQMYYRMFDKELIPEVPPHLQVPELRLHPASVVGAVGNMDVDVDLVAESEFPFGYCYLALIRNEYVQTAKEVLGFEPSLIDLVSFGDAGGFLPDVQLAQLSIRDVGGGYHVDKGGPGNTFARVLASIRAEPESQEWLIDGQTLPRGITVGADSKMLLCEWLSSQIGEPVRLSENSLDLVTNSAALLDAHSKKRLRSLEAVGDSVLSMMIARDNYFRAESVERYQNMRSFVTSNKVLSDKFVRLVPQGAVTFIPGVNPAAGTTGAKALESIFGAVWLDLGDRALSILLKSMDFMDSELQTAGSPPVLLIGEAGPSGSGSFG